MTQSEAVCEPRGELKKFTYASGTRPLDGYTIKRGVGCGGFGEVYYATSDGGKDLALKLIRRNLDVELRGVRQCLNLKHPHLVELYDVRQDGQGDTWVVMQYMAGDCLETVLAAHPQGLPESEALRWFAGVADAVAYLHDHGIVHRDLKPGNIFSDEGQVKLGDYGLSKFITVSRRSGQTESVGTVHYMAPEVANGRYGKEIDLYALGILLYELLTGHVPFEGESVGEVLMKHLTAEPDLTRLAPAYLPAVRACLDKDPKKRPASVSELLGLLPEQAGMTNRALNPPTRPQMVNQTANAPGAATDVWRGLREPAATLADRWAKMTAPAKVAVTFAVVYVLLRATPGHLEAAVLALAAAGGYWLLRSASPTASTAMNPQVGPKPAPGGPFQANPAPQIPIMMPAAQTVEPETPSQFGLAVVKPPRMRLMELTGAMLLSAAVTSAVVVIGVAVRGVHPQPELVAWQFVVSTLGSWFVLIPAKLWEGTPGDAGLRRFTMVVMGLLLGVCGWAMDDWLWVNLSYGQPLVSGVILPVGDAAYGPDGQPGLLAYLAYFGLLMLVPRWWKQADPLRPKRVSLWTTAVCVMYAVLLNKLCSFPQPWAMVAAASMSLAVQLSSPWVTWRERIQYRQARMRAGNVRPRG
jgi:hypothetical protein